MCTLLPNLAWNLTTGAHLAGQVALRSALQFGAFFGTLAVSAFALTLLSRMSSRMHRDFAWPRLPFYFFGAIGVPVHELAHAVFCILFGHRISRVKWFDPNARGGSHGSVEHSYNPRNPAHRIGQFFIGLAPALLGPVLIAVLYYLLAPAARMGTSNSLTGTATNFVTRANWSSGTFWLFIYLATAISSQIELSREDLAHARSGAIATFLAILAINLVIEAVGWAPMWHERAMAFGVAGAGAWAEIGGLATLTSLSGLVLTWIAMSAVHALMGRSPPRLF